MNKLYASIKTLVQDAKHIVIVQADNPDGDSLGSALALEQILEEQGKKVTMYCAVDMPGYIRYLSGWDRIVNELPNNFDLSIIVDTSSQTLMEQTASNNPNNGLTKKPCVVLDHHKSANNLIDYANVMVNDHSKSSTGELIFDLASELRWPIDDISGAYIMTAILGDTQGLSNSLTSANTYTVMASLTDIGVNRPKLEEQRREYSKMHPKIFRYKADLINRTKLSLEGKLALVTIPHSEIREYSPLYNPAPLIQNDMLQIKGVLVAIVLKHYDDGKITGAIRCNQLASIGGKLAKHFGGGGHDYASGFKVTDGRSFDTLKEELVTKVENLLQDLNLNKT